MVRTNGKGYIKITRFMETEPGKVFTFDTKLGFEDAIAWGKRWVDRVVY